MPYADKPHAANAFCGLIFFALMYSCQLKIIIIFVHYACNALCVVKDEACINFHNDYLIMKYMPHLVQMRKDYSVHL